VGAQNAQIWTASVVIGIEPKSAPIGGYMHVRRTEGLLRGVIGSVVQGTRPRDNPSLE
jgi:hypothetical protein